MDVKIAQQSDLERWNEFVENHRSSCMYHRFEWADIYEKTYNHKPIYLLAEHKGTVTGVLPLILINSFLWGRVLVSMPYFGYGGIIADSDEASSSLLKKAYDIGLRYKTLHIELRQLHTGGVSMPQRRDKVLMILDLAENQEDQLMLLKPRLRNKVRNAVKANFSVKIEKYPKAFFGVYSENMRYLGSPCHSQKLFAAILKTFPRHSSIVTVFHQDSPVASALVLTHKRTVEIPCVSSLREWNRHEANTRLYWSLIQYASQEGMKTFSFGRSSKKSGTFEFKRRWGAVAHDLPYGYLGKASAAKDVGENPDHRNGKRRELATTLWQKLPLQLTRYLGPKVIRQLPPIL